MKICRYLCLVMLSCSCAPLRQPDPPSYLPDIQFSNISNYTVGAWVNIHSNTPGLIGVNVEQYPDCTCKMPSAPYEGKHPSWVFFLFNSNLVHAVNYNPDGSVISGVWTNIPDTGKNWIWNDPDIIAITNGIVHNKASQVTSQ